MRKDNVVNVSFILLFAVLGALQHSTALAGTPKAVFPITSFSFGDIKQGNPITHTFSVVNRGDAPLKIERVRPG